MVQFNSGPLVDAAQKMLFAWGAKFRTQLAGINGLLRAGSSRHAIFLVVIFAIVMVIALTKLAASLDQQTVLITGFVLFTPLLLGGYAAAQALARLEQDAHIATNLTNIALELNSSRTPTDKDTLLRLEPADTDNVTISAQVVKRVVLACTEGRYEPVASILALDIPSIRAGSNNVRKVQLFAIRLGILTTFVGLMLCLYHIVPLLEGLDVHNKTAVISKIVQEMAMAFGGSVAGLLAATFLMLLSGLTENRESNLFKQIEAAILAVQTYFYYATTKEPLIRSMEALGNSIKSFNSSLDEGRIEIDRAASQVSLQIRSQDDILRMRQDEMAKGRDAFADLVSSQTKAIATLEQTLREASERVATDVRVWADTQAQTAAAHALAPGMDEMAKGRDAFADLVSSQTQAIATLEQTLRDASGRVATDIRNWVDAQVQTAAANAIATGVVEGKTVLAEHTRTVEHSLTEVNRKTVNLLERVNATLADTNRVQNSMRKVLIISVIIFTVTGLGLLGLLLFVWFSWSNSYSTPFY